MLPKNIFISASIAALSLTFISPPACGAGPSQAQIDSSVKEVDRSYRKETEKKLMQTPRTTPDPGITPPGVSIPGEYTTGKK